MSMSSIMVSTEQADPDTATSETTLLEVAHNTGTNCYVPDSSTSVDLQNFPAPDVSVKQNAVDDAIIGAQETSIDDTPPISWGWDSYRRELDRIAEAIKTAIAVADDVDEQPQDLKSIKLSFERGAWYRIPASACYTWKRMETLLRTWFQHDEERLRDLDRGTYTLRGSDNDVIIPQIWESVLVQDANINFSTIPPPPPSTRPGSPDSRQEEQQTTSGTNCDDRIQYTIKYLRRLRHGGSVCETDGSVAESSFDEPLEFEVEDEEGYAEEDLPALEEKQEIIAPEDAPPRWQRKRDRGDDANGEKKIKLLPFDRLGKTALKINSPYLLNVMKSVVSYSSESSPYDREDLENGLFEHPYKDLCLNFKALQDYKLPENSLRIRHSTMFNSKFDRHLELLESYLQGKRGVPFEATKSSWARSKLTTSFETLWVYLKPGSDVYAPEIDGSLNAYVVDSVEGGVVVKEGRKTNFKYRVKLWYLVLGATVIRPQTTTIDINVFDGQREISSLPVFPVAFKDDFDDGATKKGLIERGKKYFRYSKRPVFLQYTGRGLNEGKSYKRARVVVEHASQPWEEECRGYEFYHTDDYGELDLATRIARCECQECQGATVLVEDVDELPFKDYYRIDPNKVEDLTSHQYMLMASHMFGFVLKDREYDLLDVNLLSDPEMAENAIDKLVMDVNNKEIIKGIAKIYTYSDGDDASSTKNAVDTVSSKTGKFKRFSADFISGKGEGQIILLHGPPGTGKTLTAESVAEYTKRPLLSITAADLGHESDALEKSLLRYFRRATDWDAIVLLDEADVYLEQRSINDLQRNSIVSVFLRALDYFQGILFLTTNRVGQFDEAFLSRIHLSLGYNPLNDKARSQIWDNFFQKLRDDHRKHIGPEIKFDITAKQYAKTKEVMALEWNGREIRNAFQTAVALSVYDANYKDGGGVPCLTDNHLEQVVTMSAAFRDYMKATRQGMDDADWAAYRGNRDDRFTEGNARGR